MPIWSTAPSNRKQGAQEGLASELQDNATIVCIFEKPPEKTQECQAQGSITVSGVELAQPDNSSQWGQRHQWVGSVLIQGPKDQEMTRQDLEFTIPTTLYLKTGNMCSLSIRTVWVLRSSLPRKQSRKKVRARINYRGVSWARPRTIRSQWLSRPGRKLLYLEIQVYAMSIIYTLEARSWDETSFSFSL